MEPARFARRDDVLPDLAEARVEPDGDFGVAAADDAAGVAAGVSSGVASVVESPSFAFFFLTFFSFSDYKFQTNRSFFIIINCHFASVFLIWKHFHIIILNFLISFGKIAKENQMLFQSQNHCRRFRKRKFTRKQN